MDKPKKLKMNAKTFRIITAPIMVLFLIFCACSFYHYQLFHTFPERIPWQRRTQSNYSIWHFRLGHRLL